MCYEIEWAAPALRELQKLDKPLARRVLTAVTKLGVDPRPPGARPLTGQPPGTMRLRIGDYRVVYVIQDHLAVVPWSGSHTDARCTATCDSRTHELLRQAYCYHQQYLSDAKNPNGYCGIGGHGCSHEYPIGGSSS